MTAEHLFLLNGDGVVVSSFNYFMPTEEVVEELSLVFGTEPNNERYHGNHATGIRHIWDGLTLVGTNHASAPYRPEYWVLVTAESVHGVAIRTIDEIAVGDSAPELEAAYPDTSTRVVTGDEPERLDVLVGTIPLPDSAEYPGLDPTFSVLVIADDPAGVVTDFSAPWRNVGA